MDPIVLHQSTDFSASLKCASDRFEQEIRKETAISIALDHVDTSGDQVDLYFRAELSADEMAALRVLATVHGGQNLAGTVEVIALDGPTTFDKKPIISLWPTEGSRKTFVSPNWCDPTTWYNGSVKVTDEVPVCQDTGSWTQYKLSASLIVDTYHGKITGEDFVKDSGGFSYRVSVRVNGTASIEQDPHYGAGGGHTLDYETGLLTFLSAKQESDQVLVTYHRVAGSTFVIKPDAKKILKIRSAEVQFSRPIGLTDSVMFQAYGYVISFAPQLAQSNGGPYPDKMLIPLGNPTVYKTMSDYINEANGAYPEITPNGGNSWRDMPDTCVTYPWNYQSMTDVDANKGMEIRISLQHDTPFSGSMATATFYCLSVDE